MFKSVFHYICNKDIFKYIHPSQIEKKYNGSACNAKDYFFPPIFPSETYFINKYDNNLLVTEDSYVEIIRSNRDLIQSPHLDVSSFISKSALNDSIKHNSEITEIQKLNQSYLIENKIISLDDNILYDINDEISYVDIAYSYNKFTESIYVNSINKITSTTEESKI